MRWILLTLMKRKKTTQNLKQNYARLLVTQIFVHMETGADSHMEKMNFFNVRWTQINTSRKFAIRSKKMAIVFMEFVAILNMARKKLKK